MHQANLLRTRVGLAHEVRLAGRARARRTWPRLSIWHGKLGRTVHPGNGEALAAQWSELHGYGPEPLIDRSEAGVRHRAWGRVNRPHAIELWTLAQLGHGFSVNPAVSGGGRPGAWVTDAGVCAAQRIAAFWAL